MGKRDRERIERIRAGLESPIARQDLANRSHKGVVKELSKGSVEDQTNRLQTLVGEGSLSGGKLRSTIMKNASGEMDKAIQKFQKKNKEISVDSLLGEVRGQPGFLGMCERVGLDYAWFENLARERMEANGI